MKKERQQIKEGKLVISQYNQRNYKKKTQEIVLLCSAYLNIQYNVYEYVLILSLLENTQSNEL